MLLLGESGRAVCWDCMDIWYGTEGEPMDMEDELGSEPNAFPEVPVASESDDEEMGSASACASTLSRRERLMNSSPEGWEATAEGKSGGRVVREEARLGKRDDSMVLFRCLDDIGGGNKAGREKGGFRTSTARAATRAVEQAKRVRLSV